MAQTKRSKGDLEDGWETCSFCGKSIKSENFDRHLEKVHLGISDDESEEDVKDKYRDKKTKRSEQRKEMEMERKKKKDIISFFSMIIIIGVILGAYYLMSGDGGEGSPDNFNRANALETKAISGTNEVQIPISNVDDGLAHFYYYDSGGVRVQYFVLKSSDGVIRAAFDTCDVCYDAKKGYHQEDNLMVCNNCGQEFESTRINIEKGGCNPAPLNRSENGDNLVININDIESGKWYFE
jgi:uncharacterized membrane protein